MALVRAMKHVDGAGPWLVLIGSADVHSRADVPLRWEERRALLEVLLGDGAGLRFAPLPEKKTRGWDAEWAGYLLGAARAGLGCAPTHYVFGSDYPTSTFVDLVGVELVRFTRVQDKSSRELRRAVASGEPALLAKYAREVALLSADQRARIKTLGG